MEHAKKMTLVDTAVFNRLIRPTISDKKLSAVDQDISEILNSDMPDDVKVKHYLARLKDYRYAEPQVKKPDETESILKSIQPELRIKAKRLLQHIKPHIRWGEDGELVHDSEVVPDTSIAELLEGASTKETS